MKNKRFTKLHTTSASIILIMIMLSMTNLYLPTSKATGTPVTGAIWTTDPNGDQVNGNLYTNPKTVYLSGGPPKEGAAGLPDGTYYFQVTDPSGKTLLSTDSLDKRKFEVENGYIDSIDGGTHKWNPDTTRGYSIVVQLWPFAYTPSKGGEYKVWATSTRNYSPGQGNFGFILAFSKTDNFKAGNLNEVPKYFELWVTSGISSLENATFYVNYTTQANGVPSLWRTGQLLYNRTEGSLEVFRYGTTFAIETYIYWQFFVSNTIRWVSNLHGPEQISQADMVNQETCPLFLVSGHKYNNRPDDTNKIPMANAKMNFFTNSVNTATTYTDSTGYYYFVGTAPGYCKVSTAGWTNGTEIWYEFPESSPVDQTFDFYNYTITQMSNLQSGPLGLPSFHIVFTPSNDLPNAYKFSSTNPGSFLFNVTKYGAPGSAVNISINLPPNNANTPSGYPLGQYDSPNFILQHTNIGSTSSVDIHVYDAAGVDVTGSFIITPTANGKNVTIIGTMPSGSESILVTVHIDYQISSLLTLDQVNSFADFKYIFTVYIYGSIFGVHSIFGVT